jgi:AcrR family transcriptional regulator
MARIKIIPDAEILALVLGKLLTEGEKAVSFGLISAACGLAAPTLVQRYGSRDGMIASALAAGWAGLESLTAAAELEALVSAKGAQGLLKDISAAVDIPTLLSASQRDKALMDRAALWRASVEAALAVRLGGGVKGREAAGLMFSAWQGRLMWDGAGGKTFRLGEALRRASDHRAI